MSAVIDRLLQILTGGPSRRLVPIPVPVSRPVDARLRRKAGHRR